MLGLLLRWAIRLFFFGLIAAAVGFVVTRVLGGEDEDFEDFEDLEESFEFTETPVEIDVSGPSTLSDSADAVAGGMFDTGSDGATDVAFSDTDTDSDFASSNVAFMDTATTEPDSNTILMGNEGTEGSFATSRLEAPDTDTEPGEGEARLIDIKGIGPGYESRLQSIGISTIEDLIAADAAQLADQLSVIGGATEVENWQEQARTISSGSTQA